MTARNIVTATAGPAPHGPVRVRFTDKGAAIHIVKDPRVGAGEAFMDGRMVIEQGDIRDLVLLIRYNAPGRAAGRAEAQGPGPQGDRPDRRPARPDQLEDPLAPQCRAYLQSHPPPLRAVPRRGPAIYLAYYRDPSNSLEKAQLDKKAHIAAKLYLKPGMKVLDIGCGWGGFALYLHRHYDVDVLGVALAPDQIEFSNERAARSRASRTRSSSS